ncbi:hypothetical protein RRF57_009337 [Xylaria bambusicola]|uniref:Uncharacterized protein n=1 Tax=Xylaria bambusicola TaxID=326684 RepID=A0AAN7ZBW7_9PEZI
MPIWHGALMLGGGGSQSTPRPMSTAPLATAVQLKILSVEVLGGSVWRPTYPFPAQLAVHSLVPGVEPLRANIDYARIHQKEKSTSQRFVNRFQRTAREVFRTHPEV